MKLINLSLNLQYTIETNFLSGTVPVALPLELNSKCTVEGNLISGTNRHRVQSKLIEEMLSFFSS